MEKNYKELLQELRQKYINKKTKNKTILQNMQNVEFTIFSDITDFVRQKYLLNKIRNINDNYNFFIRTLDNILNYNSEEKLLNVIDVAIVDFGSSLKDFSNKVLQLENVEQKENSSFVEDIENLYYDKTTLKFLKDDIIDYCLFITELKKIKEE